MNPETVAQTPQGKKQDYISPTLVEFGSLVEFTGGGNGTLLDNNSGWKAQ